MAETRLNVEVAGSEFCTGVLRFVSPRAFSTQLPATFRSLAEWKRNGSRKRRKRSRLIARARRRTTSFGSPTAREFSPVFLSLRLFRGAWTATVYFTFGVTCGVLGSFCFLFSGAVVVVKDGEKRAARQTLEQKAEQPPVVEAPLQPTAHGRKATPAELAALAQFEAEKKRTEGGTKTFTESLRVTAHKLKEAARNATSELSSRASQAVVPSAEPSGASQVKVVQKYV